MTTNGLTLNQKLTLLPASIPDCILDFLEDFNFPTVLTNNPKSMKAVKPEYMEKQGQIIRAELQKMRELGAVTDVEGNPLSRQYPGSFMVKLTFEKGVRGLGFIVSQGTAATGTISVIAVQDDGFSEKFLKERLIQHYKK